MTANPAAAMAVPPDSIARSTALLDACGFTVLELARPVRGVWHLVALTASHPGVLLVGVLADLPDPLSPRLAMPGGLHPASRRLIHVWPAEGALPATPPSLPPDGSSPERSAFVAFPEATDLLSPVRQLRRFSPLPELRNCGF
jgi:hypothetical protein